MPARCLLALADDLLDLLADTLQRDAEALERLGSDAFTLVDQAEQDVLGPDVVVVEHPGLFLGQDDNTTGAVGKPLEHDRSLQSGDEEGWSPSFRKLALLVDRVLRTT